MGSKGCQLQRTIGYKTEEEACIVQYFDDAHRYGSNTYIHTYIHTYNALNQLAHDDRISLCRLLIFKEHNIKYEAVCRQLIYGTIKCKQQAV